MPNVSRARTSGARERDGPDAGRFLDVELDERARADGRADTDGRSGLESPDTVAPRRVSGQDARGLRARPHRSPVRWSWLRLRAVPEEPGRRCHRGRPAGDRCGHGRWRCRRPGRRGRAGRWRRSTASGERCRKRGRFRVRRRSEVRTQARCTTRVADWECVRREGVRWRCSVLAAPPAWPLAVLIARCTLAAAGAPPASRPVQTAPDRSSPARTDQVRRSPATGVLPAGGDAGGPVRDTAVGVRATAGPSGRGGRSALRAGGGTGCRGTELRGVRGDSDASAAFGTGRDQRPLGSCQSRHAGKGGAHPRVLAARYRWHDRRKGCGARGGRHDGGVCGIGCRWWPGFRAVRPCGVGAGRRFRLSPTSPTTGALDRPARVRIAFDRPEVRNAFRPHTVDELYRALDHARMTPDVGCVLLTGNGPSPKDGGWAFCSGGDQRIRGRYGYQYADGDAARPRPPVRPTGARPGCTSSRSSG